MTQETVRFGTVNSLDLTQSYGLAGVLHLPSSSPKEAVLIMHGLYASKDQLWMKELGERMAKELSIAALRFDFSGNGASEGKLDENSYHQFLLDVRAGISFLEAMGIKKIFLLGHSMGGGVALLAAADEHISKLLAGIIALSPVSNPPNVVKRIVKREKGFVFVEMGGAIVPLSKSYVDSALAFPRESFAGKISVPVCVIHGAKDPILFAKDSETLMPLLTKVKDKELHLVKDADHVYSMHWHEVFDIVMEWMKSHV